MIDNDFTERTYSCLSYFFRRVLRGLFVNPKTILNKLGSCYPTSIIHY